MCWPRFRSNPCSSMAMARCAMAMASSWVATSSMCSTRTGGHRARHRRPLRITCRSMAAGCSISATNWPAKSNRACACRCRQAACLWRWRCAVRWRQSSIIAKVAQRCWPKPASSRCWPCLRPICACPPTGSRCVRLCKTSMKIRHRNSPMLSPARMPIWPRAMCSRSTCRANGASTWPATRLPPTSMPPCARRIRHRLPVCCNGKTGQSPVPRRSAWSRCAATPCRPAR